MAYNATIQGGLFKGPEADPLPINRFVYELQSGIGISYKLFKANLGIKMISPEFRNGSAHAWGYISFMFTL